MENTLLIGDFLFVNKALYGAEVPIIHAHLPAVREPERNDILVFDSVEEEGLKVVKRLIGMPGDTLSMENGELFGTASESTSPMRCTPTQPARKTRSSARRCESGSCRTWPTATRRVSAGPAGVGAYRGASRLFLYDGRQPGQLLRRAVLGFSSPQERSGQATDRLLQLRPSSWRALPFLSAVRWSRLFTSPK